VNVLLSLFENRYAKVSVDDQWLDTLLQHLSLVGPNLALIGTQDVTENATGSNEERVNLGSLLDDKHMEQIKFVLLSSKQNKPDADILEKLDGFGYLRKIKDLASSSELYRVADPMLFTALKYGNTEADSDAKEQHGPALEWLVRDEPFRAKLGIPKSFDCFDGTCFACEVDGFYYGSESKEAFLVSIKRNASKQVETEVFYLPLLHLYTTTKVLKDRPKICLVCVSAFGDHSPSKAEPSSHLKTACKILSKQRPKQAQKFEEAVAQLRSYEFHQRSIDVKQFIEEFLNTDRVNFQSFVGVKKLPRK
jgi:hypothetical protein